jgi:transcriptional regulator with XRE-family HTH domain
MDYHRPMPRARSTNLDAVRFGAIIRGIRLQRGWTKKKLATRSGMNATYLGIVEEGGNVPSISTVLELTEVLGADVGDVMRQLAAARNPPRK